MNKNTVRIVSYLIILTGIFMFPWWLVFIFVLAAALYFERYYEAVFFGLIMDAIYAVPISKFSGIILVSSVTALILIVIVEFLKKRLYFYNR